MAGTPTEFEPVPPEVAARPTVRLPRQRGRPVRRRAPLALAATVTTTWAALVSYIPVVALVGLLTGHLEIPGGTRAWLLAHGAPLSTGAGRFGLVPLGVSVLAAWRVGGAGGRPGRGGGGAPSVPCAVPAGA